MRDLYWDWYYIFTTQTTLREMGNVLKDQAGVMADCRFSLLHTLWTNSRPKIPITACRGHEA